VSPVEETKAKVAEASAKIELANANQQLAAAKKRLSGLWGKGLDSNESAFIATGDLENFKPLPTLSDLIAQLSTSPQLKKASLAITQKQAFSNIEKAKQTPDVTLSLGAKRNEELALPKRLLVYLFQFPYLIKIKAVYKVLRHAKFNRRMKKLP
jgi:outer membrane protein, heavy metal efflux system